MIYYLHFKIIKAPNSSNFCAKLCDTLPCTIIKLNPPQMPMEYVYMCASMVMHARVICDFDTCAIFAHYLQCTQLSNQDEYLYRIASRLTIIYVCNECAFYKGKHFRTLFLKHHIVNIEQKFYRFYNI